MTVTSEATTAWKGSLTDGEGTVSLVAVAFTVQVLGGQLEEAVPADGEDGHRGECPAEAFDDQGDPGSLGRELPALKTTSF